MLINRKVNCSISWEQMAALACINGLQLLTVER